MVNIVQYCPYMSASYNYIGNTSTLNMFHLICASIPEYDLLSSAVFPSPMLALDQVPKREIE